MVAMTEEAGAMRKPFAPNARLVLHKHQYHALNCRLDDSKEAAAVQLELDVIVAEE
jgi:hypothetical protein